MRLIITLLILLLCFSPTKAAVEFDGSNDYFLINNSSLNLTNRLTVSAWIKPHIITGDNRQWIVLDSTNTFMSFLQGSNSHLYYRLDGATWDTGYICGTGNWLNLTFVYDGTNQYSYVNGIIQNNSPSGAGALGAVNSISIGADALGAVNDWFDGELDDLKIYNRDLTANEIEALYNSRSKRPSGSLANGLVAHYEMDDKEIGHLAAQALDSSGNLNHGEFIGFNNLVSNGFSSDVPNQIGLGTSLILDGTSNSISIPDSVSLDNLESNQKFTFVTWVNRNSNQGPIAPVFRTIATRGAHSATPWILAWDHVNDELEFVIDYGARRITRPLALAPNTWYQIAATFNGSSLELFSNAVSLGSQNETIGFGASTNNDLTIGSDNSGSDREWRGLIDNLHLYDKALTNSEISFLYNGSGLDPGTSNLQALWTFDDDSAMKDSSGNHNHGIGSGGDSLKYTDSILKR